MIQNGDFPDFDPEIATNSTSRSAKFRSPIYKPALITSIRTYLRTYLYSYLYISTETSGIAVQVVDRKDQTEKNSHGYVKPFLRVRESEIRIGRGQLPKIHVRANRLEAQPFGEQISPPKIPETSSRRNFLTETQTPTPW